MKPVNKLSSEHVLGKIKTLHGDTFDYSLFEYNGMHSKVNITCRKHGSFTPTPSNLLKGCGCTLCGIERRAKSKALKASASFIENANNKHNGFYTYNNATYVNSRTKLAITCPIHGDFNQPPSDHLMGHGCKKCAIDNSVIKYSSNTNDFVSKAKIIHNQEYDYSKVDYVSSKKKVIIICKKHGQFHQQPNGHLDGDGCPVCGQFISHAETEIAGFLAHYTTIEARNRKIITPKEIDIYLPDYKIGIEFNGLYWHSDAKHPNPINTHQNKHLLCKERGVRLIQIWSDDWVNKQPLIKSMLLCAIGINEKIYARKTNVHNISGKVAREFLNKNHLNGFRPAKLHKGLFYQNELILVMSFAKPSVFMKNQSADLEILRMATKQGYRVIGGTSKIIASIEFNTLSTFADALWFDGAGYEKIGFKPIGLTKPGYSYIPPGGKSRNHRFSFTKSKMKAKFDNFNNSLTERENMRNNGYFRLYDAGHYKFIMTRN